MQVPICRHIRPNGLQCQAIALKDQVFCYFHQRLHRTHRVYRNTIVARPDLERRGAIFDLGPLEDSVAIQIAISKTVNAIATNSIDLQHGRTLLYGLNLAAINARKLNPIPEPRAVVRELHTPPGLEQERLPDIAPPATIEIAEEVPAEIQEQIQEEPCARLEPPTELTPTPTMLERILEQEQQERTAAAQQPQPAPTPPIQNTSHQLTLAAVQASAKPTAQKSEKRRIPEANGREKTCRRRGSASRAAGCMSDLYTYGRHGTVWMGG